MLRSTMAGIAALLIVATCNTANAYHPQQVIPQERTMSIYCEAWIKWLVDGKTAPKSPHSTFPMPAWAVWQIAQACLGRPPRERENPDIKPDEMES